MSTYRLYNKPKVSEVKNVSRVIAFTLQVYMYMYIMVHARVHVTVHYIIHVHVHTCICECKAYYTQCLEEDVFIGILWCNIFAHYQTQSTYMYKSMDYKT